jgi:hypothetical protein
MKTIDFVLYLSLILLVFVGSAVAWKLYEPKMTVVTLDDKTEDALLYDLDGYADHLEFQCLYVCSWDTCSGVRDIITAADQKAVLEWRALGYFDSSSGAYADRPNLLDVALAVQKFVDKMDWNFAVKSCHRYGR